VTDEQATPAWSGAPGTAAAARLMCIGPVTALHRPERSAVQTLVHRIDSALEETRSASSRSGVPSRAELGAPSFIGTSRQVSAPVRPRNLAGEELATRLSTTSNPRRRSGVPFLAAWLTLTLRLRAHSISTAHRLWPENVARSPSSIPSCSEATSERTEIRARARIGVTLSCDSTVGALAATQRHCWT